MSWREHPNSPKHPLYGTQREDRKTMNIEQAIEKLRDEERARAAALVRAYADGRPAGEVPPLLQLAHTIETSTHHKAPELVKRGVRIERR